MKFEMQVKEKTVLPGIPDVIVAGPVSQGSCQKGDVLQLHGSESASLATCNGFELINWGAGREDWISIRLSRVEMDDLSDVTSITGLPAVRAGEVGSGAPGGHREWPAVQPPLGYRPTHVTLAAPSFVVALEAKGQRVK
jgi:hypothetical protein